MGINTQSTWRPLSLSGKINQSSLLGHHMSAIDSSRQELNLTYIAPSLYTISLPILNIPPPWHFTVLGRYLLECGPAE